MSTNYKRDALDRYQLHLPFSPGAAMSTETVAAILDCSSETVRKMLEGGELKGYKLRAVKGSPWRVYKDSVAQLLQNVRDDFDLNELDLRSAKPAKSK